MKKIKKIHIAIVSAIVAVLMLPSCTRHDQVLDTTTPVLNTDTLYSVKGTANLQPQGGPAWDGTLDAAWDAAPKLTVTATVPDLGNGTFDGFIGNSTDVTLRSMYDANNFYVLAEIPTPQKNYKTSMWFYNPTTKRWAQEAGAPSLNSDGTYRPAAAQDQFTMMFNISCQAFDKVSCYGACHKESTFGGSATSGGFMYTNGPSERLDCWRARMVQVINENQANDCFIDDGASVGYGASGTFDKNEVHGDWQVHNGTSATVPPSLQSPGVAADGGFGNTQKLQMTGTTGSANKISVPLWLKTTGSYTNDYAILMGDTVNCVKVTAVDTFGVLTLANATTIDPRTSASGTDYQQVGSGDGAKCIPGSIVDLYTGSRADVTVNAFHTGTGWKILLKRALKTADTVNDADFSSLDDRGFGIGAMFNGADNQHAICAGLTLRFKK